MKDATNLRAAQPICGTDADNGLRIPRVNPDGTVAVGGLGSGAAIPTAPGASASTTAMTGAQGVKAVAAAGTPVLLVATTTLVDSVVIVAQKSVTAANTGNIYVGFSSTGGQNYIVLTPGQSVAIQAPSGKKVDLHLIYIDAATNADAVAYTSLN